MYQCWLSVTTLVFGDSFVFVEYMESLVNLGDVVFDKVHLIGYVLVVLCLLTDLLAESQYECYLCGKFVRYYAGGFGLHLEDFFFILFFKTFLHR